MLAIIDPLLVITALVICIAGLVRRSRLWMMGQKGDSTENIGDRIKDFLVNAIGHGRILREAYPGLMHLFIFCACSCSIKTARIRISCASNSSLCFWSWTSS